MQSEDSDLNNAEPEASTNWPRVYTIVFIWLAIMCLLMYYFTLATR